MLKLKIVRNNIGPKTRQIERDLRRLPIRAHRFFVQATPIDTGNARSKTKLRGNTIDAKYPYAKRLDNGYSRQAPSGMIQPTLRFISDAVKRIILGR